jgi:hypothetical protein
MQYQMTNNPMSTSGVELQMTLWNWAFLLPLVFTIGTFLKEIKNTINKIIENIKESDK